MWKNSMRTVRKHQIQTTKEFSLEMDPNHMEPCYTNRSIDATTSKSIDNIPRREQKKEESIDVRQDVSIDMSQTDFEKNGNLKYGNLVDDYYYKRSHGVEAVLQTLEANKMHQQPSNPQPHGEESSCNLHHQLHNATSIDEHSNASIDTQPLPFDLHNDNKLDSGYLTPDEFGIFRDPEGNARAMDGRLLQVSKEDILAMANGQDNLFTQARPPDPNPYSRADMDEKLNDIYTIQYD
ncbi:LOW QUALITY PROTEIN: hypothetical protein Bca101_059128 [Brassica carinata]